MKLHSLLALIGVSTAFLIPRGTRNGLYLHTHHQNRTHTHTSLSQALDAPIVRRTVASAKFRRLDHDPNKIYGWADYWAEVWNRDHRNWIHCGNGHAKHYKLSQSDVDGAKNLFNQGCNNTVNLGNDPNDFYVVYGDVVMFMCNWGKAGQWCDNVELDYGLDKIKAFCGDNSGLNSGWFNFDPWAKAYGFDHIGETFCREDREDRT